MTNVGGQAVLEGVMMRGPSNWAVAVRKPDGVIAEVHQPIKSPMARHLVFRLPVIRGVIALGESLAIGFRALAISANYAAQAETPGFAFVVRSMQIASTIGCGAAARNHDRAASRRSLLSRLNCFRACWSAA